MKTARITHKTAVLNAQGGARLKKAVISGDEFIEPQIVRIMSEDRENGTVQILDPLDPERVLTIAAEAVELYNEATGVFQSIVALWRKIAGFFSRLFKKKP